MLLKSSLVSNSSEAAVSVLQNSLAHTVVSNKCGTIPAGLLTDLSVSADLEVGSDLPPHELRVNTSFSPWLSDLGSHYNRVYTTISSTYKIT